MRGVDHRAPKPAHRAMATELLTKVSEHILEKELWIFICRIMILDLKLSLSA